MDEIQSPVWDWRKMVIFSYANMPLILGGNYWATSKDSHPSDFHLQHVHSIKSRIYFPNSSLFEQADISKGISGSSYSLLSHLNYRPIEMGYFSLAARKCNIQSVSFMCLCKIYIFSISAFMSLHFHAWPNQMALAFINGNNYVWKMCVQGSPVLCKHCTEHICSIRMPMVRAI